MQPPTLPRRTPPPLADSSTSPSYPCFLVTNTSTHIRLFLVTNPRIRKLLELPLLSAEDNVSPTQRTPTNLKLPIWNHPCIPAPSPHMRRVSSISRGTSTVTLTHFPSTVWAVKPCLTIHSASTRSLPTQAQPPSHAYGCGKG